MSSAVTFIVHSLQPESPCTVLECPTWRDLRYRSAQLEQLSVSQIGMTMNGLIVEDDDNFPSDVVSMIRLFVLDGLCAGKGGFGAQLKSLAKMRGKKKTTDFGACRDLSGRRLRHINDEIVLQKWQEAKESGKELDVEQETPSGVDLWFLGVPSWADNVKPDKRKRWMKPRLKTSICLDWLRARENPAYVPAGAPVDWGCPRGARCEFAHGEEQLRGKSLELLQTSRKQEQQLEQMQQRDAYMDVLFRNAKEEEQVQDLVLAGMRAAKKIQTNTNTVVLKQVREEPEQEGGEGEGEDWRETDDLYLAYLDKFCATEEVEEEEVQKDKEEEQLVDDDDLVPLVSETSNLQIRGYVVRGKGLFGSLCVDGLPIGPPPLLSQGQDQTFYYEVELLSDGLMQIGWADNQFLASAAGGDGVGDDKHSWAFDGLRNKKWHFGEQFRYGSTGSGSGSSGLSMWSKGDVVGCGLTFSSSESGGRTVEVRFWMNGSDLGQAFYFSLNQEGEDKDRRFFAALSIERDEQVRVNLGHIPFRFTPTDTDIRSVLSVSSPRQSTGEEEPQQKPTEVVKEEKEDDNDNNKVFDPIELSKHHVVDSLELLGLKHLKADLERRGLKTGGTAKERAERLFSVKGLSWEEIDKKLKIKIKK